MLRNTFLTLSASMLLGTVVIAPNAALAQLPGPPPMGLGGPPVGGPPPGLGAGGPPLGGPPLAHTFGGPPGGLEGGPLHGGAVAPPRFSRFGGATDIHGLDHAVQGNLHGLEGRAAAFSNTTRNHVGNSYANPGYGHGGWRHGNWGRYGVYGYGGDSYAQAMAATTSLPTGAMFTGAFWFVPPTSRDKQSAACTGGVSPNGAVPVRPKSSITIMQAT